MGKSTYSALSKNALPFLLFGSRVKLILFFDADFALYYIQRKIAFSTNFICRLVFPKRPSYSIGKKTVYSNRKSNHFYHDVLKIAGRAVLFLRAIVENSCLKLYIIMRMFYLMSLRENLHL